MAGDAPSNKPAISNAIRTRDPFSIAGTVAYSRELALGVQMLQFETDGCPKFDTVGSERRGSSAYQRSAKRIKSATTIKTRLTS